ncbi:MAG: hypothetical protein ACKOHI_09915 [Phycisphaerales bacterium]
MAMPTFRELPLVPAVLCLACAGAAFGQGAVNGFIGGWGNPEPGGSSNTVISGNGGTGSGSSGAGFARITVLVAGSVQGWSLQVTTVASHSASFGSTFAYGIAAQGQPWWSGISGFVLSVPAGGRFSISAEASANTGTRDPVPITPVDIAPISGHLSFDPGSTTSGSIAAGTYRVRSFIVAGDIFGSSVPEYCGFPTDASVSSASGFWRIDVTPMPSPDLNAASCVDGTDLGILLNSWGARGPADLNRDGVVDGTDLGMLLGAWGPVAP